MKKRYRVLTIFVAISILSFLLFYYSFFTLSGIDGDEKTGEYASPDGKYTVTAYLNNGGATTAYAVLCTVKEDDKDKEKNIYWNYPCEKADVVWLDETTVNINGKILDVTKDTYDFRR